MFSQSLLSRATICVLLLSSAATVMAEATTCRLAEMTRSIEVVYSAPGQAVPCEVLYRKSAQGTVETLWRAANEAGYCEARAREFTVKLEGLGWVCERDAVRVDSTEKTQVN